MKYIWWLLLIISIHSTARMEENSQLHTKSLAVIQAVLNENPEDYERETKNLTEMELKKITVEAETQTGDNLLHLMAKVKSHQSYFATKIPQLIERLTIHETEKTLFKLNKKRLFPLEVAEKLGNTAVQNTLSVIKNTLKENRVKKDKLNWMKTELRAFSGIGLLLLLNGTAVLLTGGELPGGITGGLFSLAGGGLSCYAAFQKSRKIRTLD